MPLPGHSRDELAVITPDPTDPEITSVITHLGSRRPEIYYGRLEDIRTILERVCPPTNDFLETFKEGAEPIDLGDEQETVDEEALDAEINQSMLTNLVEGCLVEGVRQGASDIHILPHDGNRTDFHFRIDGMLQLWHTLEGTKAEALTAVVKDRTKEVDRFERDAAQDGFIQREVDNHRIRFRVSILPIAGPQPDRKVITDLSRIGLQAPALKEFKKALMKPQGMVILTGPTGSGKSTTLNAALHSVIDPSVCVLTVEDPVEYLIPGARQIRLAHKLRFEEAVRAILRHDPDIVMVGEMRDLETAQTAIKLSNTGHLTFSTLHTNDAASAVSRLYKMGVEPFLIANAINIVVAQRLVRTLCPHCKQPADETRVKRQVYLDAGMTNALFDKSTFYQPAGCRRCNGTGFKGRVGIHEVLVFTPEVKRLILDAGQSIDEEAIRDLAITQKMMTLRQSGLLRIAKGDTTLEAVLGTTTD